MSVHTRRVRVRDQLHLHPCVTHIVIDLDSWVGPSVLLTGGPWEPPMGRPFTLITETKAPLLGLLDDLNVRTMSCLRYVGFSFYVHRRNVVIWHKIEIVVVDVHELSLSHTAGHTKTLL